MLRPALNTFFSGLPWLHPGIYFYAFWCGLYTCEAVRCLTNAFVLFCPLGHPLYHRYSVRGIVLRLCCSPIAVVGALVVIFASFKSASESHIHVNILCRIKQSFHRLRHVLIDSQIGLTLGAYSPDFYNGTVDSASNNLTA